MSGRPSNPKPRPVLRGVARPPSKAIRRELAAYLRALVAWQRTLSRWPSLPSRVPDATAFVSLYEDGILRGCFGSDEGRPRERVARAFLRAATDQRFGGASQPGAQATATLSFAFAIRLLGEETTSLEAGVEGLLYVRDDGSPVFLLPQVARDERFGPRALANALARKAGVEGFAPDRLFSFQTHEVSTRANVDVREPSVAEAAADFLERIVARDGAVCFSVNPRTGARAPTGTMHHGRVAVVARALGAANRRSVAQRVGARLARDVGRALDGDPPEGWPDDPSVVAGTLALCVLAGLPLGGELLDAARHERLPASPWHAAQCVAALGGDAPPALYRACVADLDVRPWAPWTAIAARALGDARTLRRCTEALIDSVRPLGAPHAGGVGFGEVPEIALTAIVVEALAPEAAPRVRATVERARAFLERWSNRAGSPRGPIDPAIASGAFPLTPVDDALRCDVTAHALLALTPAVSARSPSASTRSRSSVARAWGSRSRRRA